MKTMALRRTTFYYFGHSLSRKRCRKGVMGSLREQEEPPSVVAQRDYLLAEREKSASVILTKREEEKTGRGSQQPAQREGDRFISTAERFSSTPTIPAPRCLPVKQYLPGLSRMRCGQGGQGKGVAI